MLVCVRSTHICAAKFVCWVLFCSYPLSFFLFFLFTVLLMFPVCSFNAKCFVSRGFCWLKRSFEPKCSAGTTLEAESVPVALKKNYFSGLLVGNTTLNKGCLWKENIGLYAVDSSPSSSFAGVFFFLLQTGVKSPSACVECTVRTKNVLPQFLSY